MTPRRILLAVVTASVALAAGCSGARYMPTATNLAPATTTAAASAIKSLPSSEDDAALDNLERQEYQALSSQTSQVTTFGFGPGPSHFDLMGGTVTKLLPDDTQGLTHQHFLYKGDDGKTYKVAHNTDLAPHVPVKVGDHVDFKGEIIKSKPYTIMHWTHWNPQGGEGGYIEYKGKMYDKIPGSH